MIQYILLTTIILFLIIFIIIKIKYPFWNVQPVFHYYDYWRYFYREPFAVYRYVPLKTKFCDFEQVFTFPYLDCSDKQKQQLVNLLQCYFLPSIYIIHNITMSHMDAVLTAHEEPSYVSFYYEKEKTMNSNEVSISDYNQEPTGCLTSVPVNMYFLPTLREPRYSLRKMYFINYLSSHRDRNQQQLNRSLLQTHEYNQRVLNPTIQSSIVKKEVDLVDGVIPCVCTDTHTFYIKEVKFPSLPPKNQVVEITMENLASLEDFLNNTLKSDFSTNPCFFNMIIMPDLTNLCKLIQNGNIYIYCWKIQGKVLGVFFFKDTFFLHEKLDGNTIHLIASVNLTPNSEHFYTGFLFALKSILEKKKSYKVLVIDELSHNILIVNQWSQYNNPVSTTQTGYYLFNYIIPVTPLDPTKTLFIL